jgi:N-acetyl-gamma-glutamyl-phosphate reductase
MEIALARRSKAPVELLFTPHLAPMNRGILATCYLRPTANETTDDLLQIMAEFYEGENFVQVSADVPSTKATLGSNSVHMTVRRDERTGWVVALGALDNLIKGAAGHAIQCLNVALGFDEATGLETAGVYS